MSTAAVSGWRSIVWARRGAIAIVPITRFVVITVIVEIRLSGSVFIQTSITLTTIISIVADFSLVHITLARWRFIHPFNFRNNGPPESIYFVVGPIWLQNQWKNINKQTNDVSLTEFELTMVWMRRILDEQTTTYYHTKCSGAVCNTFQRNCSMDSRSCNGPPAAVEFLDNW